MKRIFLISLSIGVLLLPPIALWSQGYVFGPNVRVSDYPPGTAICWTPDAGQRGIAVRGDTVYCVWSDTRAGRHNWFAKSIDGGQTFLPNVMVDDGVGPSASPTIAVGNDGTIYVAFEYAGAPYSFVQVYFAKSTDGGLTFTPDVVVNDTAGVIKNKPHGVPSMTIDSAEVIYIAWHDGRNGPPNYNIYFSKSTDGGSTFLPDILVNDTVPGDTSWHLFPGLAADDSENVYVVWQDMRYHSWYDIYFSKSTDGGMTFQPDVVVSDTDSCDYRMDASVNVDARGFIHCVWYENDITDVNIFYSRSSDSGLTFSPQIMVNDTINEPEPQCSPSFCIDDSGMVYAVWENGPTTLADIYFTLSTDNGDSAFVEPDVLVDETDSSCDGASVAVGDSGKVYVLWSDERTGLPYYDVYFASGKFESGIEEIKQSNPKTQKIKLSTEPNPFNSNVTIYLEMYDEECTMYDTEISIYDMSGRRVRSFVLHPSSSIIPIVWDGTDQEGKEVPAGIYFIQASTGNITIRTKIIRVK